MRVSSIVVVAWVALGSASCGGERKAPGTPVAAAERALTLASRQDELGFAKTLARGPRGQSTADVQLEILSVWLWTRWAGAVGLVSAELEGWDALRAEASTSTTATVVTVLRFKSSLDTPPERPVPVEIELVLEDGAWRIADARMKPTPAWFLGDHEEQVEMARRIGETPPEPPRSPTLAEIADTYRPPPKNWKRER